LFRATGLNDAMMASVEMVPGGVGEVFLPAVWIAPWFLFLFPALVPTLAVRAGRRKRMEVVEQDLPLALELFATLSEAGMAFDAALERVLGTRLGERPLAREFRSFQGDLLAGRPRVQALRRLSSRIEVPSMAVFISAIVQAEQLGMGIAQVLRRQADDLRDRRRERANTFAQQLPVKRVIPLVVCFLPGLFVWTLGPVFVQLFQMAEKFTQTSGMP
jgi:tight adherence protein C